MMTFPNCDTTRPLPAPTNASNTRTGYARVDTGCWGWAESHELMHTLGAVQNTAPHSTYGVQPGAFAHCTDEYDIMCYADAPGTATRRVCSGRASEMRLDCNHDDYYNTSPDWTKTISTNYGASPRCGGGTYRGVGRGWVSGSGGATATPGIGL